MSESVIEGIEPTLSRSRSCLLICSLYRRRFYQASPDLSIGSKMSAYGTCRSTNDAFRVIFEAADMTSQ